ncbi:MAG: hypothetical protein JSR30_00150 [Proteobacteria bacterium]|nr:hypothetical protein [Pseudomonadota bacterium]
MARTKRKSARSGARGGKARPRKAEPDPNRLTRNALAKLTGLALSYVQTAMAKPGAPMPDAKRRYDVAEAKAFLEENAKWAAGAMTPQTKQLKQRKLELELEEAEHKAAIRRGSVISKDEVKATIAALGIELFQMIKRKFVDELPSLYQGKTEVERRQLNEAAYNAICTSFREGALKIEQPANP